jgi:hypothetical protein
VHCAPHALRVCFADQCNDCPHDTRCHSHLRVDKHTQPQASTDDHPDANRGYVKVFDHTEDGVWVQRGATLWGDGKLDYANVVSLSANGNVLAIGARETGDNDQLYAGRGYVRVFDWDPGNAWVQRGPHVYGVAVLDQFGASVSLSASGDTVAVGAPFAFRDGVAEAGYVCVFDFDADTNTWSQRGSLIIDTSGAPTGERLGHSVSLAADGSSVAVGAPYGGAGRALIFDWDSTTDSWVQRGPGIAGSVSGDQLGHVVSLSAGGGVVAITAPVHDSERGQTRVYSFCQCPELPAVCTVDGWVPRGSTIDGEEYNDRSGWSAMELSSRGDVVAIGA